MMCARRLADAQRPASSTHSPAPAGSSRSDAPTAGSRARLFLLPVLALLLGALSLFHAVPAKAQAPAAPTGITITANDTNLDVSWTASTTTGNVNYSIQYTTAPASGQGSVANNAAPSSDQIDPSSGWVNSSVTTTAIFYSLGSLTNDMLHRVRIRANLGSESSAWVHGSGTPTITLDWPFSSVTRVEGVEVVDNIPILVSTTSGYTQAVNAPVTYAGGSSNPASLTDDLQTGYATTISSTPNTPVSFLIATPVDDTVNEEHETYTITINAGTGYTVGTPSTLTVTITDNDPPAAPTLTVAPGGLRLTASWVKPDGPVADYEFRYKTALAPDQAATGDDPSTGWVTTLVSLTSQIITGLTAGTAYQVQVRANDGQTETGNGYGEWSALQTGTPTALPRITLSATPNPVDEGESVTVTVTLPSAPAETVEFPVALTADTAETSDYGALTSITVSAGETTGKGTITTIVDTDPDDEIFEVAITKAAAASKGYAAGPGTAVDILINDLSELSLEVKYGDQRLGIGPYGDLGDPTHTYVRYVQASPTMNNLSLKLSWTDGTIASNPTAQVYYYMPGEAGTTLTWASGDNGMTKMLYMYNTLGRPGYPRVTLSAGAGIEYTIIFQNNGRWEFHNNNLLERLGITVPSGQ